MTSDNKVVFVGGKCNCPACKGKDTMPHGRLLSLAGARRLLEAVKGAGLEKGTASP